MLISSVKSSCCIRCLHILLQTYTMERAKICRFYFQLGLEYKHILCFLAEVHGICISMGTLKRILRKKFHADILETALFVQDKLLSEGRYQGYRWMHLQCIQKGLNVSRDTIQILMKLLDPVGVEMRRKKRLRRRQYFTKGPDFL